MSSMGQLLSGASHQQQYNTGIASIATGENNIHSWDMSQYMLNRM